MTLNELSVKIDSQLRVIQGCVESIRAYADEMESKARDMFKENLRLYAELSEKGSDIDGKE